MSDCVCRSGLEFEACCKPILEGKPAPTAETLMRARFTAFVSKDVAFLERTLGQNLKADFDRHAVLQAMGDAQGLGVEILFKEGGETQDAEGVLEYVARFKVGGKPLAHHERARFVREDGAWVYADGEVNPKTAPVQVDKVGRNDPCPCGSGKKYKKCCGA